MSNRVIFIFIYIYICVNGQLRCQSELLADESPRFGKAWLWGTGSAAVLSYGALYKLWYARYPRSPLHSFNDFDEWLQMDKAGHATTTYHLSLIGYRLFKGAGIVETRAAWYGALAGNLYLTGVEVLDGFSSQWGFSWSDMAANMSGSIIFLSQQQVWNEQRFRLKFSFYPSRFAHCRPEILGRSFTQQLLKDYNGQTYWLSANVFSLTNRTAPFPRWLNIALGYGADAMLDARGYAHPDECGYEGMRSRQFYLSFDVDLTRIQSRMKWFNELKHVFGFIKIPSPTVEYSVEKGWFFHPIFF